MNLDERTAALLELVEQYRARRFAELLEPAHTDARQTVRAALADARRRVHTAIVEERKRYAVEVGAVEAALATERRLSRQHQAVQLLESAWRDLRTGLLERWTVPATRERWVRAYLERARRAVPCGADGWRIQTQAAWDAAERARWLDHLRTEGIGPVVIETDPSIGAGFRVVSGNNVLDATLDGLLADRAQLEGRLLHHLQWEQP